MKKILFLLLACVLFSCGSNKPTEEQKEKAKRYVETLVNMGVNPNRSLGFLSVVWQ